MRTGGAIRSSRSSTALRVIAVIGVLACPVPHSGWAASNTPEPGSATGREPSYAVARWAVDLAMEMQGLPPVDGGVFPTSPALLPLRQEAISADDVGAPVLAIPVGRSIVLDTGDPITRVSVTNPAIAEPVAISPTQILVNGLAPGITSLFMWPKAGSPIIYEVEVHLDAKRLSEEIQAIFPGSQIRVHASRDSIVLSGPVSSFETAEKLKQLAMGYSPKVIDDMMSPGGSRRQVMLHVKFAEVGRSVMEEIATVLHHVDPENPRGSNRGTSGTGEFAPPGGNLLNEPIGPDLSFGDVINLSFFEKGLNLGVFITALKSRGLFQELAEPTLIAVDGEEASFLAGGEFPVPIAQPGAGFVSVTVSWKKFGISLDFTPRIKDNDVIVLKVKPEVSSLDFVNAVLIEGFRIPSLIVRRIETEIELKSGQSFAIAGLYDRNLLKSRSKIPVLGDIPLLGRLFRSKNLSKQRTELLVIVTPTIVQAIDAGEELPLPSMPELLEPDPPI